MNQQDFIDWKRHPVTQEVFSQLAQRVKYIHEILGESAGSDPAQDRVYVGYIKAYNDMLQAEYEQTEETQ